MTIHFGDVSADRVLYIPFASYGANGESITLSGLAVGDVEIYKNGGTTQRAGSDSGIALLDTDGIDFDGITGIHGFSIDLQDDTDAGFYSVGDFYWVIVSAVTINAQTVNFVAATFRIVAMEGVTGFPKADVGAIRGDEQSAIDLKDFADAGYDPATNKVQGVVLVDTVTTLTNLPTIPSNWITAAGINADAITAAKIADGAIDAATFAAGAITASAIAADAIGASELAADAVAEIADAIWEETLADHEGTVGSTAEALADAGGAGASAADIADAVWDEATAGHVAAGSFGKLSADVLADTNELQTNQNNWLTATGFSTHSAADVWAVGTRVLTAGTNIVLAKGTGITGFNDITAAAVVAAMGTGTFLTAVPWNADWDVQVESEVADALAVYDPPTNAEMEARTIAAASYATAAALTTVDTVVDAIKVITDALGATAAARLNLSANQIIPGTVDTVTNTHTPTTTEFQADDITEATADHYNGRIIIFTSGALAGQATSISDYVAVGGIGQFTVVSLTEAPANNDTFIVL